MQRSADFIGIEAEVSFEPAFHCTKGNYLMFQPKLYIIILLSPDSKDVEKLPCGLSKGRR